MHCFLLFNIEILLDLPAVVLVIHLCFELFSFYFLIHLVLNQSRKLKLNTFTIAWIWRASCLKHLPIDLIFILCILICFHSFTVCCNDFTGYFYMICLVSLYDPSRFITFYTNTVSAQLMLKMTYILKLYFIDLMESLQPDDDSPIIQTYGGLCISLKSSLLSLFLFQRSQTLI